MMKWHAGLWIFDRDGFAINGEIERIGDEIFLCIPENYEVSGSTTSQFDTSKL